MSKHWYSNVISPFILTGRHNSNSRHLPLRYHSARLFMISCNLLQSGNVRDSCRWQWTVCFATMRREKDAISGMMADYGAAQHASLRLNLQPLCLPRTAWPQFLSSLLSSFPPSLPLPCSETSLGASILLYFSRDVFKYTAVIVGLPIIQFLPVHLSPVTLQVEDLHFDVTADRSADAEHVRSYQDESNAFRV